MRTPRTAKAVLLVSGLVAIGIGGAILLAPVAFHEVNGIHLDGSSLLSETRAPGGALLATGVLITLGAFVPRLTFTAAIAGALTYLSYGLSRVLSVAVDGVPASGLVLSAAVEMVIGLACALVLVRHIRQDRGAGPS
ncbi:DUF4345 domain-containing protein [Streptosporangium sp. NPDC051023]|uniref:DUF4345 domain-containing protein n=1 Tax=Streptosporangium sp. NPDC051023 TaxID=3155410 RepID=UPI00344C4FB2